MKVLLSEPHYIFSDLEKFRVDVLSILSNELFQKFTDS